MERMRHEAGTHCWLDLTTSDLAAARKFYTEILAFGYQEVPMPGEASGTYTMIEVGGEVQGGMSEACEEEDGVPPHWTLYTAVDDVDATAARATELCGQVLAPPFDIPETGRMAVLQGAGGEVFAVWDRNSPHPGSLVQDRNRQGAFCWGELASRDTEQAAGFYSGLFGWKASTQDMGGMPYTLFVKGSQQVGGLFTLPPEMKEAPPAWLLYFMVPDASAALKRTEELGGRTLAPAMKVPGVGTVALLQDPQGAVFGVVGP